MGENPALLKAGEVAAMLRVTPQTVYRWAEADKNGVVVLPSISIGGVVRFRAEDVEALLNNQEAAI